LGLSVVRAIVEAQRGEVGVKSRQPVGATFWFTIPLSGMDGESE
jgi:signal transduction histidine kinase